MRESIHRPGSSRFVAVLLAAALLASCRLPGAEGKAGAEIPSWIWRNHDLRHVEAAAFYLVREFELSAVPEVARLRVMGDEEYVLFVNEQRLGSGRWRLGQGGDEFDPRSELVAGRNRLIVELRSATGAGGLWLELEADGRVVARSGADWSVYQGAPRGLFNGGVIPLGEPPMVLGRTPVGRWGEMGEFVRRPIFESVLADEEPVPAVAWRAWGSGAEWRPFEPRWRRPPSLGPLVEVDFGEERFGYLQLAFRDSGDLADQAALVRFGLVPMASPKLAGNLLLRPIVGRNLYQDSVPRRFRYVGVAALPGLFAAEVLTVRETACAELDCSTAPVAARGLLGVTPPPSSSPVENEIWRELERSSGVRIREDR